MSLKSTWFDAKWWLRVKLHRLQWLELLRGQREVWRGVERACSQAELQLIVSTDARSWLQCQLRSFPRWAQGHYQFGCCALVDRDFAAALASAQALGLIEGASLRQQLLLGKVYLRSQDFDRALNIFESCWVEGLSSASIGKRLFLELVEESVAAAIAKGRLDQARSFLQRVPVDEYSSDLQAASQYLRYTLEGK
jgi:tetratricopeptide (TPR) repeat protein